MTNDVWTDAGKELDSSHRLTSVTRLHVGDAQASAELGLAVESYGARHGIELRATHQRLSPVLLSVLVQE